MSLRLLITAGPTHEPIDQVRYLANRSSGKLGLALAQAGREAGCQVTLLLGPVEVQPPNGVTCYRFQSVADLEALLAAHLAGCDVLLMAAAPADYRPVVARAGKLPRRGEKLVLELEPTPDLVAACAANKREGQFILAFALEEPDHLLERAKEKLERKRVDAIVANPLSTMGSETINATVLTPTSADSPGPMTKDDFAQWLIGWVMGKLKR